MKDETGQEIYRKLLYYFDSEKWVHFKDLDGIFYNGKIIDLNKEKETMVLHERVRGEIPILLECIDSNSIETFKLTGKEEDANKS